MRKLRISAFLTTGLLGLGISSAAWAATGGNANAGDVWVDSVTAPTGGPGHEMDPHLPCSDINLWGSGLADATGDFTIDGWPPSGSQEVDYASTPWNYDQSGGRKSGSQVIAVINVKTLISQAVANGDAPSAQGYHFKLDFSQDPQKHKTFWVDCTPTTSGGGGDGGGGGNTGGGGGNNGGGGGNNGGGDGNNGGGGGKTGGGGSTSTPSTPSTTNPVVTSIGGATAIRNTHQTHRHHHKRIRRHKIRLSRVRAVRIRLPTFTG